MKSSTAQVATVLISRRIKPGSEQEFVRLTTELLDHAAGFPGHLGSHLVDPGDAAGIDANLYHLVLAFRSQDDLAVWQGSRQRNDGLDRIALLTEGDPQVRPVTGLDLWFTPPATKPPPRWKVAIVTWLGIFPIVLGQTVLVGDRLSSWPLVLRIGLLSVLIVALMNWVVAPALTRLFRRWLQAGNTVPGDPARSTRR